MSDNPSHILLVISVELYIRIWPYVGDGKIESLTFYKWRAFKNGKRRLENIDHLTKKQWFPQYNIQYLKFKKKRCSLANLIGKTFDNGNKQWPQHRSFVGSSKG